MTLPKPIKFVDSRLDSALEAIGRQTGLSIEFDHSVTDADRARRIGHVTVLRTTVADVLGFLTSRNGLTFTMVGATTVRIARRT
jgi:hypothetical protein